MSWLTCLLCCDHWQSSLVISVLGGLFYAPGGFVELCSVIGETCGCCALYVGSVGYWWILEEGFDLIVQ